MDLIQRSVTLHASRPALGTKRADGFAFITYAEAITEGGCQWSCAFGPVLTNALADVASDEVTSLSAELHGQRFRVIVNGLDRAVGHGVADDAAERSEQARTRFGGAPWLLPLLLGAGALPALPPDRASIM